MRRQFPALVLSLLLLLWPWLAGRPVSAAGTVPEVTADGVVVWDDSADEVLYSKNPHQRFAPASITKIMTAILAIERGDLDEVVPIETDAGELAARTDSTTMGLYPGERLSLRNLLYGLMLPSGNDAAIEIARYIGGSEGGFVQLMNEKAAALGMKNTHYMNPHGLDHEQHYTTAYDMTILGRYAMRNPQFAEIVGTRSRVFYGYEGRKLYQLGNLDRHIGTDGYDGVKIGYTDNALATYVGTARRDGRRLFVTVLHSRGWARDGERLFDYFFDQPAPATTTPTPVTAARAQPTAPPTGIAPPQPVAATTSTATPLPAVVAPVGPTTVAAARPASAAPGADSPPGGLLGLLAGLSEAIWHRFQT